MKSHSQQRKETVEFKEYHEFDESVAALVQHDDGDLVGLDDSPHDLDDLEEPVLVNASVTRKSSDAMNRLITLSYTEEETELAKECLVRDIHDGRVIWTETFWRDCWIYLKNNHALFGLFLSHPLHPLNRWFRYAIFVAQIFFNVVGPVVHLMFHADEFEFDEKDTEHERVVYSYITIYVFSFFSFLYIFLLLWIGKSRCGQALGCVRFCDLVKGTFVICGVIFALLVGISGVDAATEYESAAKFLVLYVLTIVMSWFYGPPVTVRIPAVGATSNLPLADYLYVSPLLQSSHHTASCLSEFMLAHDIGKVVLDGSISNEPPTTDFPRGPYFILMASRERFSEVNLASGDN